VSSVTGAVTVRVNGKELQLPRGASVASLLAKLDVSTPRVAVERNREIVPKALYAATSLVEGDELEVVEFVGGG
jgi:sulfur carrier protein